MEANANTNSLSPTPRKSESENNEGEVLMTFAQAMEIILIDKKVHKLDWKDKGYYGVLENDILMLVKPDGSKTRWSLSRGDIAGTDYIII